MEFPIFTYSPEKPLNPYGIEEAASAAIEGNKICINYDFGFDPVTYFCGNTGGIGEQYGLSFGNVASLSFFLCFVALSLLLLNRSLINH